MAVLKALIMFAGFMAILGGVSGQGGIWIVGGGVLIALGLIIKK